MRFPLLLLLLGMGVSSQAQFINLNEPLQNDSVYKNASVKSRFIRYDKRTTRNNRKEFFNKKGQITEAIIYSQQDGETPQYQTKYSYDDSGKLVSSLFKDLTGNFGHIINPYSKRSNESVAKYEYDSANNLIRRINIDSAGTIYREMIYVENPHSEILKDYNDNKQLCSESICVFGTNNLPIKIESRYNLIDTSKIKILQTSYTYELDEMGRMIKSFASTEQSKSIFQYYYDNNGLLIKILVSGPSEMETLISYKFR